MDKVYTTKIAYD
jgi:hypothetical protein